MISGYLVAAAIISFISFLFQLCFITQFCKWVYTLVTNLQHGGCISWLMLQMLTADYPLTKPSQLLHIKLKLCHHTGQKINLWVCCKWGKALTLQLHCCSFTIVNLFFNSFFQAKYIFFKYRKYLLIMTVSLQVSVRWNEIPNVFRSLVPNDAWHLLSSSLCGHQNNVLYVMEMWRGRDNLRTGLITHEQLHARGRDKLQELAVSHCFQ